MKKWITALVRWFKRLSPVTSLNYVLFDISAGFGLITYLLYIKTPPSVSAASVLNDTLYKFIGPPTYGLILFGFCVIGLICSGLPDLHLRRGFYAVLGSMTLWVGSLLFSCLYSNASADEINRILVTCIFIAMLISGCLRWLVAHHRNGRLR